MEPVKRQDVDQDIIKVIEQEENGEAVFLGDLEPGEIKPRLTAGFDQLEAEMRDSIEQGICIDCGKAFGNKWVYPPPEAAKEGPLGDGWSVYYTPTGEALFVVCPKCDEV